MKLTHAFVLTTGLLAAGCGTQQSPGGVEERFAVSKLTLRDVITQTGEVSPVVKVDVKCEASGRIERIFVKEGQRVHVGEKLLTIDPERLLMRKKQLDLTVDESKIKMEMAKRDFERAKELFGTGSVPQGQLDNLESAYNLSEIDYRQQQLARDDVAEQLAETTVPAPMSGVLTNLAVEEGEIVVSATSGMQEGTMIGTVANVESLEVVTQVGEVDYPKLQLGQAVVIRPEASEGAQSHGHIDFISLTAKKHNTDELGTFEVRIEVDSVVPGIVPGVNVNVEFVVLEKAGVLGVPYRCVQRQAGQASVLAMHTGKDGRRTVEPVTVTTGSTDYRNCEILSGLSEGDTVVYRGPAEDKSHPGGPARH